jgi:hypothetical protein
MLAGLALIVAGVALLALARTYFEVADPANKELARRMREGSAPRFVVWLNDRNARGGARSTVRLGRAVALAAIAGGVVLVIRAG